MPARDQSTDEFTYAGAGAAGHLRVVSPERASPAMESTIAASPARGHVVAVDDAPEIRDLLADLLQSDGYRVTTLAAPPGPGELAGLAPDLIVLDLLYHGECSGLDFISGLRGDPAFQALPMVVCTGASDAARQVEAALAQFDVGMVLKPFDIETLLSEIAQRLARRS
ncbi:MAG TPA: response regulator [Thermomicrobiales bacterium]|nr:response regulator [Thermomicrobiales bacterium]